MTARSTAPQARAASPKFTVQDAAGFVQRWYSHRFDRSDDPMQWHLWAVATGARSDTEKIASLLHDWFEDFIIKGEKNPVVAEQKIAIWSNYLRGLGVSELVIRIVDKLSRRPGETYEDYIDRARAVDSSIKPVWLERRATEMTCRIKLRDMAHNQLPRRLELLPSIDVTRMLIKRENAFPKVRASLREFQEDRRMERTFGPSEGPLEQAS